jgi:hypothetical protein
VNVILALARAYPQFMVIMYVLFTLLQSHSEPLPPVEP